MALQQRMLIVDDDTIHRMIYASIAQKMDYAVDLASSVDEANEILGTRHFDCVVLDLQLGDRQGVAVIEYVSRLAMKPPILLVTGATEKAVAHTMRAGRALGVELFGPVRKPVNVTLIRTLLRSIVQAAAAGLATGGGPIAHGFEFSI